MKKSYLYLVRTVDGKPGFITSHKRLATSMQKQGREYSIIPFFGKAEGGTLAQALYRFGQPVVAVQSRKPTAMIAVVYGTDSVHDIPIHDTPSEE